MRSEVVRRLLELIQKARLPHSGASNSLELLEVFMNLLTGADDNMIDVSCRLEWKVQGLSVDLQSVQNALITSWIVSGDNFRIPLLIDPHEQGERWLVRNQAGNGIVVFNCQNETSHTICLVVLKSCKERTPLFLTNITENNFEVVELIKDLSRFSSMAGVNVGDDSGGSGGGGDDVLDTIFLNDMAIDVYEDWRCFLSTALPQTAFNTDFWFKCCPIDFESTEEGLQEQLLNEVIRLEFPSLELEQMTMKRAQFKTDQQLRQTRRSLLSGLVDLEGDLIEDTTIVTQLTEAKKIASDLLRKQETLSQSNKDLQDTKAKFQSVAIRGSILFTVASSLVSIEHIYSFAGSMSGFLDIFREGLKMPVKPHRRNSVSGPLLLSRAEELGYTVTEQFWERISGGLFERHRALFAFEMASSIDRVEGRVEGEMISMLLVAGKSTTNTSEAESERVLEQAWLPLQLARTLQHLKDVNVQFHDVITRMFLPGNTKRLKAWFESPTPEDVELHRPLFQSMLRVQVPLFQNSGATSQNKRRASSSGPAPDLQVLFWVLIIVKILRKDRVANAIQNYIARSLGSNILERASSLEVLSQAVNLHATSEGGMNGHGYAHGYSGVSSHMRNEHESFSANPSTRRPLLFIVSEGSNPTDLVRQLAAKESVVLNIMATGEGRNDVILASIESAMAAGNWVMIQNAQLSLPLMEQLYASSNNQAQDSTEPAQDRDALTGSSNRPIRPTSPTFFDRAQRHKPRDQSSTSNLLGAVSSLETKEARRVSSRFRLFLSAEASASSKFPPNFLRGCSSVLTSENNGRFDANMMHFLASAMDHKMLDESQNQQWKRLVFVLCWLHASVVVRSQHRSVGFSVPYEISNDDVHACLSCALGYVKNNEGASDQPLVVDWNAIRTLVCDVTVGGKMGDSRDRETLQLYGEQWLTPRMFEPFFELNSSLPNMELPLSEMVGFFADSSSSLDSEVFQHIGLHLNAGLQLGATQGNDLVCTLGVVFNAKGNRLLRTMEGGSGAHSMSRTATGGNADQQELQLQTICNMLLSSLPEGFKMDALERALHQMGPSKPFVAFLSEEIIVFEQVLSVIRSSIQQLCNALNGKVHLSEVDRAIAESLLLFEVPLHWNMVQTAPHLSLVNGIKYMQKQSEQLQAWATQGAHMVMRDKNASRSARDGNEAVRLQTYIPQLLWFGGFKFPMTILTALKQEVVRFQVQNQAIAAALKQQRPNSASKRPSSATTRPNSAIARPNSATMRSNGVSKKIDSQEDGSTSSFHSWNIEGLHLQSIISPEGTMAQDFTAVVGLVEAEFEIAVQGLHLEGCSLLTRNRTSSGAKSQFHCLGEPCPYVLREELPTVRLFYSNSAHSAKWAAAASSSPGACYLDLALFINIFVRLPVSLFCFLCMLTSPICSVSYRA
jgi:dynein heavy chain